MAQLDSAKEGRSAFGVLAAAACSFGLVALVAAANAHGEKLAAEARAKRDVRQTRAESKPVGPGLRRPSRRRSPACECCKLIEDGRRLADAGRARQGRRKETARRARAAPGPVAHGHGVPVAAPLGRPRLPVAVRLAEHRPGAAAVALVLTCISRLLALRKFVKYPRRFLSRRNAVCGDYPRRGRGNVANSAATRLSTPGDFLELYVVSPNSPRFLPRELFRATRCLLEPYARV